MRLKSVRATELFPDSGPDSRIRAHDMVFAANADNTTEAVTLES